jgi:hypothetical protein
MRLNPTVNQSAILKRIAVKVARAADRLGYLPATGTQAVLRCRGIVKYVKPEYVN